LSQKKEMQATMNLSKGAGLTHLQAVIFDMDGLMVDTESIYHLAWRKAAATFGYTLSESTLLTTTGRPLTDCYTILQQAVDQAFPMAAFVELWPRLWHEHIDRHGVPQKPGLLGLLDLLDKHQIPKAVATSTAKSRHCRPLLTDHFGRSNYKWQTGA
jgi:beta-phosphoglucomutase-like phosphatase (HAD superfamily)